MDSDLSLLPRYLAERSISDREIVLSLEDAIEAINVLESKNYLVLGWEGWIKTPAGRKGHGNAPQGTVSLDNFTVEEAADFCRRTIAKDSEAWEEENTGSKNELYFCITVDA